MLEIITQGKRLSARLRSEVQTRCGTAVLNALLEHIERKQNGDFDTRRPWQIMEVLELSELAHRLQDMAATIDSDNIANLELVRLTREVFADYRKVYELTMLRTMGAPSMEFFHHPSENDNRGSFTVVE